MQRDQILQMAISKKLSAEQIGKNSLTSFSIVHQCFCSINKKEITEEEKKEELIENLQNFWRGNSMRIAGSKREHVQNIVKSAFGVGSKDSNLGGGVYSLAFQELFLYYSYIERLAKVNGNFSKYLWNDYGKKHERAFAQKREMEQQKKEEQEQEEIKKLEGMSKEEKWKYEIYEKGKDIEYYNQFSDGTEISNKDRMEIARILKEFWEKTGKWEGAKVNRKQKNRIQKIKEILRNSKQII